MISTRPHVPEHGAGFARHSGESAHPDLREGLVGAWVPFLGPTGTTLFDWSGYGNDGTLVNMSPAADWVPGARGWALRFTAGSGAVTARPAQVDQAAGTVVLDYCRRATVGGYQGLLNVETAGNDSPHEMLWFQNPAQLRFHPNYDQAVSRYWDFGFSLNDLAAGDWTSLAVTWGEQQIRGYRDGIQEGSENGSGAWPSSAWDNELLNIGRVVYLSLNCAGEIGAFYLFDRPLPAATIRRLHEDICAPLRLRRRVLCMLPPVGGPYQATAAQTFHPGAVAGALFHTGAAEGEILHT